MWGTFTPPYLFLVLYILILSPSLEKTQLTRTISPNFTFPHLISRGPCLIITILSMYPTFKDLMQNLPPPYPLKAPRATHSERVNSWIYQDRKCQMTQTIPESSSPPLNAEVFRVETILEVTIFNVDSTAGCTAPDVPNPSLSLPSPPFCLYRSQIAAPLFKYKVRVLR